MRLRALLLTAISIIGIAEAGLLREPPNKQYYRGTTPNILAWREFMEYRDVFMGSEVFWQSFVVQLQIDTTNNLSACSEEVLAYMNIYRSFQDYGATALFYNTGRTDKGSG